MFTAAGSFLDPDLLVRLSLMVMSGGEKKRKDISPGAAAETHSATIM